MELKILLTTIISFILTLLVINADDRPMWRIPEWVQRVYGLVIFTHLVIIIGSLLLFIWS